MTIEIRHIEHHGETLFSALDVLQTLGYRCEKSGTTSRNMRNLCPTARSAKEYGLATFVRVNSIVLTVEELRALVLSSRKDTRKLELWLQDRGFW